MLRRVVALGLALLPLVAFPGDRTSSPAERTKDAPTGDRFVPEAPGLRGSSPVPATGWQLASRKKWEELSDEEKRRIREVREQYRKLPPEKQEELRRKWQDLPDRKKERYRLERERKER